VQLVVSDCHDNTRLQWSHICLLDTRVWLVAAAAGELPDQRTMRHTEWPTGIHEMSLYLKVM